MLKRILVSLLVYIMAVYPMMGSLANADSNKSAKGTVPDLRTERSGVVESGPSPSDKVKLQETYGKLPLSFIQNNGKEDEKVKFYEKGSGHTTFFTKEGMYLSLRKGSETNVNVIARSEDSSPVIARDEVSKQSQDRFGTGSAISPKDGIASPEPALSKNEGVRNDNDVQAAIVKLTPIGANKSPEIIAEDKQEGKVSYFIGNDPKKWKTNIPTYGAVVYKEIYKNIDMKFYGNNRQLEYDIIVKPGADLSIVKLSYEGIEGLKVTEDGDLLISLKEGDIIQKKPNIYQEIDGKRVEVDGRFKVLSSNSELRTPNSELIYGFQVASYNKNHPLIIDPVLVYSTYLGGSGNESYDNESDYNDTIAVDGSGNAYIIGRTNSTDFPTASPYQVSIGGSYDVFVTKINASGTELIYSTYLGGSGIDDGFGIAVDTSGNAYVTGHTLSTNFPTANPIQGSNAGDYDAFVTKINPTGSGLVYSTYLGGSYYEYGYDIAVDGSGNAYITGITASTNFPTLNPIQGNNAGLYDAFVTKLNASGTELIYSTYLGGSDYEYGWSIAVDDTGNAYVAGHTQSANFPTVNPIQGSLTGYVDAFVTKLNAFGTELIYSTYLGGSANDSGFGIAVDGSGNAYVTGHTDSTDFPTVNPIQGSHAGYRDAFVVKISPIISGCIQLNGSPVVGSSVTLKQKRETDQITTTSTSGCYHFDTAVSGKTFQVIINGPSVP